MSVLSGHDITLRWRYKRAAVPTITSRQAHKMIERLLTVTFNINSINQAKNTENSCNIIYVHLPDE